MRVLGCFEPSVSSTDVVLYSADSVAPDMIASSIVLAALSIRAGLSSLSLVEACLLVLIRVQLNGV